MSVLISCQSLGKSYSARPLFANISFGIEEDERLGLIGPNGSGKSTLLKVLAGLEKPDSGTVSARRGLRIGYVPQEEAFAPGQSVEAVLSEALAGEAMDERERATQIEITLARVGFIDREQRVENLSGGWRKRLAIARALIRRPDLLLMDEPTNHLDLEGVLWLEGLLKQAPFAYLVVSHDRYFLENVARRVVELNPAYSEGYLSVNGAYSDFLLVREEYLSAQAHQQQALASKVRREIEWLRRGAQARSTKAKGRIDAAGRMIEDLAEIKFRNAQNASVGIDFSASGRKTKELLVAKGVEKRFGDRTLFTGLDLTLSPGMKLGLVGTNGSGKTTLLRVLTGVLAPDQGTVKRAEGLRAVWFDQNREQLDKEATLRDALCPNGDTVLYRGSPMHVASWAKRFGFRTEQLAGQVGRLSGGEQARVLIANLMVQPADLLILDEPTNDLDIPTLEVLEDSLQDFPGALMLVTHDRYLLDTVSTQVLALDGQGAGRLFAGYEQWEAARNVPAPVDAAPPKRPSRTAPAPTPPRPGLSSAERRELRDMEARIEAAERKVEAVQREMEDTAVVSDHVKLQDAWDRLHAAQEAVTRLYARWEELEARQNQVTS